MIRLIAPIPRRVCLAVSGGSDSMAALDFALRGGREVRVLHFDHGTLHASEARGFLEDFCGSRGLDLVVSGLRRARDSRQSLEEYWSAERHRFFAEHLDWGPVVTGHHLDDAVEWWVMTSLHGTPRLMHPVNRNTGVIRPFLATPRAELEAWCVRRGVPWVSDPSNSSRAHMRNVVRLDIIPHALRVNPGLATVVRKRLLAAARPESGAGEYLGEERTAQ